MRPILLGTGFYAKPEQHLDRLEFFYRWLRNCDQPAIEQIVIVDNSEKGLEASLSKEVKLIRITNNLGHVAAPEAKKNKLTGWSMSWILPALIAYSENCDFVYKEQDCLAFGDWLPQIRLNKVSFGNHPTMECEQSLFYIEREFIPDFVQIYLSLPDPDHLCITEKKFALVESFLGPNFVTRHNLGPGRGRPLPADPKAGPWYAQQFTAAELDWLKAERLI